MHWCVFVFTGDVCVFSSETVVERIVIRRWACFISDNPWFQGNQMVAFDIHPPWCSESFGCIWDNWIHLDYCHTKSSLIIYPKNHLSIVFNSSGVSSEDTCQPYRWNIATQFQRRPAFRKSVIAVPFSHLYLYYI